MDYDLAKKLKDAGFPQKNGQAFGGSLVESERGLEFEFDGSETVYTPTLEELIEACGDSFEVLEQRTNWSKTFEYRHPRDLWAAGCSPKHQIWYGSTPIEAVANLWLALHPKD